MKKLAFILFMICASAYAQTTNDSATFYRADESNLYSRIYGSYQDLTPLLEIVKPAYFCLTGGTDPRITADSVSLVGGGLVSGTVTNTRTIDNTYYIVEESSRPDIRFTHTNIFSEPIETLWEGYYDGNPSHSWTYLLWDYVDGDWDIVELNVLDVKDGTDFGIIIPIPEPQTNYNFGGVVTSRWYHSASIVGANQVGFDYTAILQASVTIPTAGVFEAVNSFDECVSTKRFNLGGADGAVTNTTAGVYEFTLGGSSTGSTNTEFHAVMFTNDVQTSIQLYRTLGAQPQIGNAWGHGLLDLAAGTKLQVKITSNGDGTHASFLDFKYIGKKIDN
jgi:hypothetical protein